MYAQTRCYLMMNFHLVKIFIFLCFMSTKISKYILLNLFLKEANFRVLHKSCSIVGGGSGGGFGGTPPPRPLPLPLAAIFHPTQYSKLWDFEVKGTYRDKECNLKIFWASYNISSSVKQSHLKFQISNRDVL